LLKANFVTVKAWKFKEGSVVA